MKHLIIAFTLFTPAIASAHPGHSHEGMSPYHHIYEAGAAFALAAGVFYLGRALRSRLRRRRD